MSATDLLENDLIDLIFTNTDSTALIGGTGLRGSTAAGSFWVALHSAAPDSPGEAPANQAVNEMTYPGYARQEVIRAASGSPNGGWTVAGAAVSNAAEIAFGEHSGGSPASETATHYSIGTSDTSSEVLFFGTLNSSLPVTVGINPRYGAGALQITVD